MSELTETVNNHEERNDREISLKALRLSARTILSNLLNPLKVLPSENGLPRDWRGLVHLIGFKADMIPVISSDSDPTAKLLNLWQKRDNPPFTIKQLQTFLEELDRFDIIDDTEELIAQDVLHYTSSSEKTIGDVSPVVDEVDRHILTVDDVTRLNQGLSTQIYDAFVVFAEEDIDFATELIETLERQYGFKLCVKERDLVGGTFEHEAIVELISQRCNRLIAIISPAYLKSAANKFVVNYAQAVGIEQGKRKIIPCLYEACELPQALRHTFMLKYQRSGKLYNFWDRLRDSIQATNDPSQIRTQKISQPQTEEYKHQPECPIALKSNSCKYKKSSKKEFGVKFGSMSNLTVIEPSETKRSASINTLTTSPNTATNNVVDNTATTTAVVVADNNRVKKWFKNKFNTTHKNGTKKPCNTIAGDKEKKKWFWERTKIKVPV